MKKTILAAAAAILVATGLAAPASAVEAKPTRQADFIPSLSDTRSGGSYDFLREGLSIKTQGISSRDKVAEYIAEKPQGIPAFASYTWYGTAAQPGVQIVFDMDGERDNYNSFNVLVGEQVYSTNAPGETLTDWWFSGGKTKATGLGITCPSTSPGSGSDCHGTLPQWQAALPAPAQMYASGFSLGSGVRGEGVLRNYIVGNSLYDFTATPATVAPPAPAVVDTTGSVSKVKTKRSIRLTFLSDALPPNSVSGAPLTWAVQVDGNRTYTQIVQGPGETDKFTQRFTRRGAHSITVFRNGALFKEYTLRVRR